MAEYVKVSKGQVVPQNVWQSLSDQHGGGQPDTKPKDVTDDYLQGTIGKKEAQRATEGYDQRPVYRYFFADGSYVDARTSADYKDYEIVDYRPSDTFTAQRKADEKPASTSTTATNTSTSYEWRDLGNGQRRLHVITKDRNGNVIGDDEATPQQQRDYEISEQRSRNPGGKTDAEIKTETDTKRNKWTTIKEDTVTDETTGKSKKVITERNDLGEERTREVTSQTIAKDKQETKDIDGVPHRVVRDEKGNVVRYEPIEIAGQSALPAEARNFRPDPTQPGYGLFARRDQLDALVEAGTITKQQRDQALKQDYDLTKSWAEQADSIVKTQQQKYTSDVSLYGQRSQFNTNKTAAGRDIFQQARTAADSALPYTGGDAAAKIFSAMLQLGKQYLEGYGGLTEPTVPVPGPAYEQQATLRLPGGAELNLPMGGQSNQAAQAQQANPAIWALRAMPSAMGILDPRQTPTEILPALLSALNPRSVASPTPTPAPAPEPVGAGVGSGLGLNEDEDEER